MNSIVEKLFKNSVETPLKTAVVFESGSANYTELRDEILRIAGYFKNHDLKKGDVVIAQCKYDVTFIAALFATHLCKAMFVPVDKNPTVESILDLKNRLNAKIIIGEPSLNCGVTYEEISASGEPLAFEDVTFPQTDDYADIMFTTGTTGAPKGVVLSHKNLLKTAETRVYECGIKKDNVCITLVPLNHVAPLRELYLNIYNGSTVIFIDGMIRIKTMFEYMAEYNVSSLYIPPAGILLLQQLSKNKLNEFKDSIDYVYTGSAPMQTIQQEYMRSCLPESRLFFSYGSSENGSVCLHRYDLYKKDITCCGKPCVGVDVIIIDDDFNLLPSRKLGRIAIKSDMNMVGYFNMPEQNDIVFKNGYFVSNDIGYYDEEGFLYVSGRKDDIINIGGLKVYPSEIETAAL